MEKVKIVLDVLPEQKKELQEKAKELNLSLKDYLVLKGLNKLN